MILSRIPDGPELLIGIQSVEKQNPIGRKEELQALKARVRAVEARLEYLERRIRKLQQGHGISLYIAVVDPEKCLGCGSCEASCPVGAVFVGETARIDLRRCIGCGRCANECPQGAISLRPVSLNHGRQAGGTYQK